MSDPNNIILDKNNLDENNGLMTAYAQTIQQAQLTDTQGTANSANNNNNTINPVQESGNNKFIKIHSIFSEKNFINENQIRDNMVMLEISFTYVQRHLKVAEAVTPYDSSNKKPGHVELDREIKGQKKGTIANNNIDDSDDEFSSGDGEPLMYSPPPEFGRDQNNIIIFMSIPMPHYVGDETTIPQDLQNIFKYVFWFQQKMKTCDLPFFPSILTMMKMWKSTKIVDDQDYLVNFIDLLHSIKIKKKNDGTPATITATSAAANSDNVIQEFAKDLVTDGTLTKENLIKSIKYLEYYFGECAKKMDTLPSIPIIDEKLDKIKKKTIQLYKLITDWATKTYKTLYDTDIVTDIVTVNNAAEFFFKIIIVYFQFVHRQSDILYGIILDETVTLTTDINIIENNMKKITELLSENTKYLSLEELLNSYDFQIPPRPPIVGSTSSMAVGGGGKSKNSRKKTVKRNTRKEHTARHVP